jgi:hypothetical protein
MKDGKKYFQDTPFPALTSNIRLGRKDLQGRNTRVLLPGASLVNKKKFYTTDTSITTTSCWQNTSSCYSI